MNIVPTKIDSPIFNKVVPIVVPKYDKFRKDIPKEQRKVILGYNPAKIFPKIESSDNMTSQYNIDSDRFTMNNNDLDDKGSLVNKKRYEFKEGRKEEKASPPRKSKGGSKNITKKQNKKTRKYHRNKKTKKNTLQKKKIFKKKQI
uniref:Uncharacterized protein n=1 Tax=viral metagenome TaxID=1070528 RepID=A0A6C0E9U2_9ZZZZ